VPPPLGGRTWNVVFDLGGVVFTWDPEQIIRNRYPEPGLQDLVRRQVFRHPDWQALDRGTLPLEEAIERAAGRTGMPAREIAGLLDSLPDALQPIPGTVELLHRVKAAGSRLFCLSNMHRDVIERLERANPFWHLFDGRVISCRVRRIKPEPGIYAHLLDTYGLIAEETVFIDDMEVNLGPAARRRMRVIRFEDPEQCAGALQSIGAI